MLIFLVGYMGCGKSSIGRALAKRLGFNFLDCDSEIERITFLSVGEFFATEGEQRFRELERQVILEAAQCSSTIVATGGGAPCFFDNMEVMNAAGLTIYFKMNVSKLVSRLERGRLKRPLIRDKSDAELVDFITQNLEKREPYYMQSKLVIDCDTVSDSYIADHIAIYIDNHNNEDI